MSEITIREARGEDAAALLGLAELDESPVPSGSALLVRMSTLMSWQVAASRQREAAGVTAAGSSGRRSRARAKASRARSRWSRS